MNEFCWTNDSLRLSILRALQGNTPESLVEVRFHNGTHIIYEFVFEGLINEDEREMVSVAETEMLSDLPSFMTSESRWIENGLGSSARLLAYQRPSNKL